VNVLGGHTAADQQRAVRQDRAQGRQFGRVGAGARGRAGDDQGVGQPAQTQVARLVGRRPGRQRRRVLDPDIGQDADGGPEFTALTERVPGTALDQALVGDRGAGVDVDPDEGRADRDRDRQGRFRIVAKDVDAQGAVGQFPPHCVRDGRQGRDRDRRDRAGMERRILEILDHEGAHAALSQGPTVPQRRCGDRCQIASPAGAAGQGLQMEHADDAWPAQVGKSRSGPGDQGGVLPVGSRHGLGAGHMVE